MKEYELNSKIFSSSTYEGLCDINGFPIQQYYDFYKDLAVNNVKNIITGFAFIDVKGRAMHVGQAGIDNDNKIEYYKKLCHIVHEHGSRIYMQIAHTGRQSRSNITGSRLLSPSSKRSVYFREKPKKLTIQEIESIVESFGEAALRAKKSGFDGVQIHGAHGYLIHQFLLEGINDRRDKYGISKELGLGVKFLDEIIDRIREKCGTAYPLLIKISGGVDIDDKFTTERFINLIKYLNSKSLHMIEISYGTMDFALNIFRGDVPYQLILDKNPLFYSTNPLRIALTKKVIFPWYKNKLKDYSEAYNLDYAKLAKEHTNTPIISVGGFRTKKTIVDALKNNYCDYVGLCRPFLAEIDLMNSLNQCQEYTFKCINCNYCAVMTDTGVASKCYKFTKGVK